MAARVFLSRLMGLVLALGIPIVLQGCGGSDTCDMSKVDKCASDYATNAAAAAGDKTKICGELDSYTTCFTSSIIGCSEDNVKASQDAMNSIIKEQGCGGDQTCHVSKVAKCASDYATNEAAAAGDKTKICDALDSYTTCFSSSIVGCRADTVKISEDAMNTMKESKKALCTDTCDMSKVDKCATDYATSILIPMASGDTTKQCEVVDSYATCFTSSSAGCSSDTVKAQRDAINGVEESMKLLCPKEAEKELPLETKMIGDAAEQAAKTQFV